MRDDSFGARVGVDWPQTERQGADEALLEEVRAMLRDADPVPQHVKDAARDLSTWQSFDAAVARLLSGDTPPARTAPR